MRAGGEQLQRALRAQRVAAVQAADVVACTLASAGGDLLALLEGKPVFDALIIDEARAVRCTCECVCITRMLTHDV